MVFNCNYNDVIKSGKSVIYTKHFIFFPYKLMSSKKLWFYYIYALFLSFHKSSFLISNTIFKIFRQLNYSSHLLFVLIRINNEYLELIRSQTKWLDTRRGEGAKSRHARCLKSVIKLGIKVKDDAEDLFCRLATTI